MKISLAYSNSASIPTGVPYEQQKPFYSLSWEVDLPVNIDKETFSKELLARMKAIVDPMVLLDLKNMNVIRLRCSCVPSFDNQNKKYIHAETCLIGTAVRSA